MLFRGPWAEAVELFRAFGKLAITLRHDCTDSARLIFLMVYVHFLPWKHLVTLVEKFFNGKNLCQVEKCTGMYIEVFFVGLLINYPYLISMGHLCNK